MSYHGNCSLLYGSNAAYCTLLAFGKTGCGTGGCYCRNGCLGVAECVNYNLSQSYFTAYCTLLTCAKTGCGTAGCYFRNGFLGVAISLSLVCNVRVVTYGAGIGGITACGTGGLGYCCAVAMAKCCNLGLCFGYSTTYGALLTLGKAGCGTSGSYRRKSFLGVSGELSVFLATSGALCSLLAGSSTAGAGMSNLLAADGTLIVHEVVTGALKDRKDNVVDSNLNELIAVLNVKLVTALAGVELYVTGCLIGRSLSLMLLRLGGVVVIFLGYGEDGS